MNQVKLAVFAANRIWPRKSSIAEFEKRYNTSGRMAIIAPAAKKDKFFKDFAICDTTELLLKDSIDFKNSTSGTVITKAPNRSILNMKVMHAIIPEKK